MLQRIDETIRQYPQGVSETGQSKVHCCSSVGTVPDDFNCLALLPGRRIPRFSPLPPCSILRVIRAFGGSRPQVFLALPSNLKTLNLQTGLPAPKLVNDTARCTRELISTKDKIVWNKPRRQIPVGSVASFCRRRGRRKRDSIPITMHFFGQMLAAVLSTPASVRSQPQDKQT
jgi:hypothetical protein